MIFLLVNIALFVYTASVYIKLASNFITALIVSTLVSLLSWVVRAYILLASFGYEPYVQFSKRVWLDGAMAILFLIGVVLSIFTPDEAAAEIADSKSFGRVKTEYPKYGAKHRFYGRSALK